MMVMELRYIFWNLPRQRICWRRREQRESSVSPRPQSLFDMKVFLALVFNKESVCRHRVSIFARHCHAWSLVWISSSGGLSSYSLCWSCWHLTSLIKAIVCPNFAILIVQSIDCTRGTSSLFCPQRVTETDGLELLVVTNTIPQVSFFSYQVETRREKHKSIATLRRGDLRSVTSWGWLTWHRPLQRRWGSIVSIVKEWWWSWWQHWHTWWRLVEIEQFKTQSTMLSLS